MDDKTISFIKGQLKALVASTSVDHSRGIAEALLAFLEVNCPTPVVLRILDVKMRPNKEYSYAIEAIKEIRGSLGLGLAESKMLLDRRNILYKGTDIAKAISLRNKLEPYLELELDGPENMKLLFDRTK